jgi:hypothetical protein
MEQPIDFYSNLTLQAVILTSQLIVLLVFTIELVRKILYSPRNSLRTYSLLALSCGLASLASSIFGYQEFAYLDWIILPVMACITTFLYWSTAFWCLWASIYRYSQLSIPKAGITRILSFIRVYLIALLVLGINTVHIIWRFKDNSVNSLQLPFLRHLFSINLHHPRSSLKLP